MKILLSGFKLVFGVLFLCLISCEYEFVEVEAIDKDIPVSFSETIQTIFANNRCVTCHHSDYQEIDLSAEKAYAAIVPQLIDTLNPELSIIYLFPNPGTSHHQFKKYTPAEAEMVLTWITQGAKNN
ncbi:MAG: hypothetical protein JXR22_04770 [Prolixibacteraceae bacterium]|nr:hypothetical protein [Prolixibacteraceae bacterium]